MVRNAAKRLLPDSVLLAAFIGLAFSLGRVVLPVGDPPAFLMEPVGSGWVELGQGFDPAGFRQYFGDLGPGGIINLTQGNLIDPEVLENPDWIRPFENGERLDIRLNGGKIAGFHRSWMTAWSRITLAIPLNPDRMMRDDWPALPGIGKKIAERIELDRQKNGDFGNLRALQRVSGIGPKRIAAWEGYFYDN
jgi:competence protein ComEA